MVREKQLPLSRELDHGLNARTVASRLELKAHG